MPVKLIGRGGVGVGMGRKSGNTGGKKLIVVEESLFDYQMPKMQLSVTGNHASLIKNCFLLN